MTQLKSSVNRLNSYITDNKAGVILLIIGVLIGIGGFLFLHVGNWSLIKVIQDFYANFSTELISIALTVLIIEYLNRRRQEQSLKAQLVREMGSGDNGFALRAVAELKAHQWTIDGSLQAIDLSKANLRGAQLQQADLAGATLTGADLSEADLLGANLAQTNLWGSCLTRANLREANLSGANLQEVDLTRAWLLGTDLSETNLRKANLAGAILENVSRANLSKVINPVEANIRERHSINLQGAKYDQDTIWPEGFDPVEAGAVESSDVELVRAIPQKLIK